LRRYNAEISFLPAELAEIKRKMLNWSSRFSISLFLDSNSYKDPNGRYECLLGAGAQKTIRKGDPNVFHDLYALWEEEHDWLFGHLCYDLKNELQSHLSSQHTGHYSFSPLQFFVPQVVCSIAFGTSTLIISSLDADPKRIAQEILDGPEVPETELPVLEFQSIHRQDEYLATISKLKEHIREGDCYEITFCNEAYTRVKDLDPRAVYSHLTTRSPTPFAAFYQDETSSMVCASPERFLQKRGSIIRSQPIKGTVKRSADPEQDAHLKASLKESQKERAENVMIVDLVRNDLAICCETGSVEVEELFGLYTYPNVHQMISTISGKLRKDQTFANALQSCFPMGSMTGAPKHRVMQLIDQYERSRRELFSGSVGYIDPEGDFDFNVIIRSLFYESQSGYLSYQTGGAITWGSDPQSEWEELRLKARAMEGIFL